MTQMPEDQPLRGRDIVCVGFADWDTELWTNQHHLMSRLASKNEVLFVESLGLRRPQLSGRDLSRIARRLRRGLAPPRTVDGVHVLSPLVLPAHRHRAARALNARLLPAIVSRAAKRLRMSRPILWAYAPQAETLLAALHPALVIYHCVDDIAAQPGVDGASFRAAEARMLRSADLVLASSPPLHRRLSELSDRVLYAPNVADVDLFATALQPGRQDAALSALPHPRIVFTGAIVQTKLDMELLLAAARLRPQWSIALVGPIGAGDPGTDVSLLQTQANIHLLGHRAHDRLPDVLRAADAAIIPYAINPLTASVFPMKVYEYLAAGLPVVSTPLPSLAGVAQIARASSAEELVQALEQALAADSPALRAQRSADASSHSWDRRLAEIAEAIRAVQASEGLPA
jgi:glycosyltransferase involved in cell wall biosynthesis